MRSRSRLGSPLVRAVRLACVVVLAVPASAQTMDEARQLAQDGEWKRALAAFRTISENEPDNGAAWFGRGNALLQLERWEDSIVALERADELGFARGTTRFNLARACARKGDADAAFEWLRRAAESGFAGVSRLDGSTELAALRDDARFEPARTAIDRNARPCRYDERYREFDFWIGRWEVFTPQGVLAGSNVIERRIADCMLFESWTGAGGSVGQSLNFVDPGSGKWRQLWVDGGGGTIDVEGGLRDGAMVLEGWHTLRDGTRKRFRGSWTPLPDGRVRQFLEESNDEGESWSTWFEGFYVRR